VVILRVTPAAAERPFLAIHLLQVLAQAAEILQGTPAAAVEAAQAANLDRASSRLPEPRIRLEILAFQIPGDPAHGLRVGIPDHGRVVRTLTSLGYRLGALGSAVNRVPGPSDRRLPGRNRPDPLSLGDHMHYEFKPISAQNSPTTSDKVASQQG
jgi:hypothetical protein